MGGEGGHYRMGPLLWNFVLLIRVTLLFMCHHGQKVACRRLTLVELMDWTGTHISTLPHSVECSSGISFNGFSGHSS